MRFVMMAAVAGLGMSAPLNAATWVYDVTGDYSFNLYETRNVGAVYPETTHTTGVHTQTYRVFIESNVPSGVSADISSSFMGFSAGTRLGSGYVINWRNVGGQTFFDSASFFAENGAYAPCAPGPVGCYNFAIVATASNLVGNFVTSIGGPAPVPEPATWAMLIGGFGMVGGTMRYRRRGTSVAFADGATTQRA